MWTRFLIFFLETWIALSSGDSKDGLGPIDSVLYLGEWGVNDLAFMESSRGRCLFLAGFKDEDESTLKFIVQMFDGLWESDPVFYLVSDSSQPGSLKYERESLIITVNNTMLLKNHMGNIMETCEFQGTIEFTEKDGYFNMSGKISSTKCGELNLEGKGQKIDDMRSAAVLYGAFFTCISICLLYGYLKHTTECLSSESYAKKSSLLTWFMLSCIDCVLCLWHMQAAFGSLTNFDYYILCSCWGLGCLMVGNGKVMVAVWRAQNIESIDFGVFGLRREISRFQNKILLFMMSVVLITFSLDSMYLVSIVVLHAFFVPQIIKTTVEGQKNPMNPVVIVLIAISRVALIMYFFNCPGNVKVWEPIPAYGLFLSIFIVLQAGVLLLQRTRCGPRFLIPRVLRPKAYCYYRTLEEEKQQEENDCAICMVSLDLEGRRIESGSRIMHTPCVHRFHEDCLSKWMDMKMECPTCRSVLPMLEDE